METTLKGTMRAMHTATGLPFPLFSLSFQASWPISSKFFVLYSSKLVLYMIEGCTLACSESSKKMNINTHDTSKLKLRTCSKTETFLGNEPKVSELRRILTKVLSVSDRKNFKRLKKFVDAAVH